MIRTHPYRPWGELHWALRLAEPVKWHFLGCLGTEQRSIEAVLSLHSCELLEAVNLVRIKDTRPINEKKEQAIIEKQQQRCSDEGLPVNLEEITLEAPLNHKTWSSGMDFSSRENLLIDISSLPKRFFFSAIQSALLCSQVRNLVALYSQPKSYPPPPQEISSNPNSWEAMANFTPLDPDIQADIDANLIISAGFVVGGLVKQLENRSSAPKVSLIIPFPANDWNAVRRSWISARQLEDSLQLPKEPSGMQSSDIYRRVGAWDCSSAFDLLVGLTRSGLVPATLAPLGPKPISMAMCLLASQTDFRHPVYYAQPKTYALNYSEGYLNTYAYWIKCNGENLYSLNTFQ
jgi:hypothetical protein